MTVERKCTIVLKSSFKVILLSLLLLAIPLAGCSEGGETNTDASTPDAGTAQDAAPTQTDEPEETGESFDPGLLEKDFDGRTFTFFTKANSSWSDWLESSIWTEGMTGEVLNDAVFERNDYVSDLYNVLFEEYAPNSGAFNGEAEAVVKAGDTTYDVLMPPLNLAGGLLKKGLASTGR